MDAGEITQCAQMSDEDWGFLYVTSIAFSLHKNNHVLIHSLVDLSRILSSFGRPDPSSPREAAIKLDIPVDMGEHDIQIHRGVCNPMANGEPVLRADH